jgi:LAO/AO transport system kinase
VSPVRGAETGAGLAAGVRNRERAAIARAISLVECNAEGADELLRELRGAIGRAHRVGVTGPPGAGKSSLIGALAGAIADAGHTIGVLAVDPSSQFTHGAVLGDRVRMAELDRSERIFIRSMASRGQGGGLGPRSDAAADVLDAAGFDWIFIESVGVGQVELDIRHLVDTTLVALVPESGDQVQAIKAGLMEIADLYVVNKCDRPEAGAMAAAVQSCVAQQHHPDPDWLPRVLRAAVINGEGIAELLAELERHRGHLGAGDRLARRRRDALRARLRRRIEQQLAERLFAALSDAELLRAADRVQAGTESLDAAAARLLAEHEGGARRRGAGS